MKNDIENYIERRKRVDREFATDFEAGYEEFKIGVLLRQACEQAGVTQEALARITGTKKSAISRLENHAEDVRLSTFSKLARALGKTVRIELVGTGAGGGGRTRLERNTVRAPALKTA
jgi:transcriptional regulator with XRE-family HTH domain